MWHGNPPSTNYSNLYFPPLSHLRNFVMQAIPADRGSTYERVSIFYMWFGKNSRKIARKMTKKLQKSIILPKNYSIQDWKVVSSCQISNNSNILWLKTLKQLKFWQNKKPFRKKIVEFWKILLKIGISVDFRTKLEFPWLFLREITVNTLAHHCSYYFHWNFARKHQILRAFRPKSAKKMMQYASEGNNRAIAWRSSLIFCIYLK